MGRAALAGALKAEGLRIDAPQYGLHFTDGRVVARAADGRIVIEEIVLGAGAGTFRASGEIAGLAPGGEPPVARLAWRAERFRAFNRPDLRLVVGGEGTAVAEKGKVSLSGKLRVDEGAIVYLATPDATLGDDVVVKGWTRPAGEALRVEDVPLVVDLALDLGDRLAFSGEGIETGLAGVVHVTTGPSGLLGKGSIRTVRGTYFAFGQRLAIDRGRLIFDGRLDNPGLDIVALRKNLAVEAGVTITGTVKVPVIQLTSNPPVPDSEKLSWLVLGQPLDRTFRRGRRGAAGRLRRDPRLPTAGRYPPRSRSASGSTTSRSRAPPERSAAANPGRRAPRVRSSPSASGCRTACRSSTSRASPSRPTPFGSNTT